MSIEAHPAELSSLPAILRAVPYREDFTPETVRTRLAVDTPDAAWCAEVGRTAADVAALMFRLPMFEGLRSVFEVEIRAAVRLHTLGRSKAVERHCQDVAWIRLRSTARALGEASLRRGGVMRFVVIIAKLAAIHLAIIALRLRYCWVVYRLRTGRIRGSMGRD